MHYVLGSVPLLALRTPYSCFFFFLKIHYLKNLTVHLGYNISLLIQTNVGEKKNKKTQEFPFVCVCASQINKVEKKATGHKGNVA